MARKLFKYSLAVNVLLVKLELRLKNLDRFDLHEDTKAYGL